jgi:hypothetical protein
VYTLEILHLRYVSPEQGDRPIVFRAKVAVVAEVDEPEVGKFDQCWKKRFDALCVKIAVCKTEAPTGTVGFLVEGVCDWTQFAAKVVTT